jgi:hypothetical protein
MSDEAQSSQAPKEPRELQLLGFISQHFAVFSLLGAAFVVLCSTLFLYGYLSVFDRQLIWIIEYPDILKFGLIALAVISTFIWTIHWFIENAISAARSEKRRVTTVGIIVAVALVLFVIPVIVECIRKLRLDTACSSLSEHRQFC